MKGLKDFRRSLNKDRQSGGRPGAAAPAVFTGVKHAVSIQPPKKVIRATRDYRSRAPQELSFSKGDFFHVLSDESGNPEWLEATNPVSNARGLVPAAYFDILTNARPPGAGGSGSNLSSPTLGGPAGSVRSTAAGAAVTAKGGGGLYAVVKYDFSAERADELEAKAGEPIIVIAQSNFEWFVAKPIGRLGGPGLIPVAFVEIKDLATGKIVDNVQELIESGVVPKVEEWKKMTADYKKNTIPLGRFDFGGSAPVSNSPFGSTDVAVSGAAIPPTPPSKDAELSSSARYGDVQQGGEVEGAVELPAGMSPGEPLPAGLVTSATVDSFHFEQGDYWFRIQAAHVAHDPLPGTDPESRIPRAPNGEERDLILYRLYDDFYEFQIALLDHYPAEAGRETRADGTPSERILPLMPGPLDEVDDLITSQRRVDLDAYIVELTSLPDYILKSELVRLFFEPRPGDHCTTHPLVAGASVEGELGKEYSYLSGALGNRASVAQGTGVSNGTNKYAEDMPVGNHVDDMSRSVGNLSIGENGQRVSGRSSDLRSDTKSAGSHLNPHGSMARNHSAATFESQGSNASGALRHQPSLGNQSSMSAGSYIKIKIFNKANDDLVAIRVPPNVTYASLLDKVKERLGNELAALRYKDAPPSEGGSGHNVRLYDDDDLKEWLGSGAKLTLYADVK
ncbi:hypothetical protein IE81DRAFT_300708 [Ceraceosorus guamensis]|uniref:Protein scd2/ral3 n=1 Tax=Ceraceosorus guamensis TaxID=1522189 RepID=A0A316W165_9BASI|nr:hypothetical protein IE81DRAFT_300708 [Ceraceosorus guamensis]PWN43429.1 hypothetical protein IE81DRAFT_300708 [Ceraceosorus guamensis]